MKWIKRILLTKLSVVTFSIVGLVSYGGWKTYEYYEPFLADSHANHTGAISDCLLNKTKFIPPKDSSLTEYEILFFTELTEKIDENLRKQAEKLRGREVLSAKAAQKIISRIEAEQRDILASMGEETLGRRHVGNYFPQALAKYLDLSGAHAELIAAASKQSLTEKDRQIFADYGSYFSDKIIPLTTGLETDSMSRKYLAKGKASYVQFQ